MLTVCFQCSPTKKEALLQRWSLVHSEDSDIIISEVEEKLSVSHRSHPKMKPLSVDFVSGAVAHRRKFGGGRSQTIAKAIGLKGNKTWKVLDATAGLGRDAFVFATLGCDVVLFERHPVVAALLDDGLQRAYQDPEIGSWMQKRMKLIYGSSLNYLSESTEQVDVVYLDPMYPHKEKSALVKKDMRMFQELIGQDEDADQLLEPARRLAKERVVVKRPQFAEPLDGVQPHITYDMKKNRFDVYLQNT